MRVVEIGKLFFELLQLDVIFLVRIYNSDNILLVLLHIIIIIIIIIKQHSRYSDWLRAIRLRGRSSSPRRGKILLLSSSSSPVLGPTQPPIQWVERTLSPGVKRPGREADHSFPTNAEVKNKWIYTSTPPCDFMG
jgi:hypothetical protein